MRPSSPRDLWENEQAAPLAPGAQGRQPDAPAALDRQHSEMFFTCQRDHIRISRRLRTPSSPRILPHLLRGFCYKREEKRKKIGVFRDCLTADE